MEFTNVYEDAQRAESYASLEFPGTYYLAYRDLPEIFTRHVTGKSALDFGCGTGRSTRFLKKLGFETVGADVSGDMLEQARRRDPIGEYCLVEDDDLNLLGKRNYDLILSVFTFDNIPTPQRKVAIFKNLKSLLNPAGRLVNLVSSPEIYTHEWASFTTKCFPENFVARSGDTVRTIMLDIGDRRPVEDIFWPDEAYREVFGQAGLEVLQVYKPLGTEQEPIPWVNETRIAPWVIYVLKMEGKYSE